MIITCDLGATNITGYFLYFGGLLFDFATYEGKNWICHVENTERLIKEKRPQLFILEDCWKLAVNKQGYANYHFRDLLKAIGGTELILSKNNIPYKNIYATDWIDWEKVKGLERRKEGRKKIWYFKDRKITEHEKDALLLFWIHWTKMEKKEWPWI